MLDYNNIVPKKFIVLDEEPYEVVSSHVFRKQQRKPVNQTKLRHLITGKVTERSFHASDKVAEADLEKRDVTFLYENKGKGEWWFCDKGDPRARMTIARDTIGDKARFMKENSDVIALIFQEKIIGIDLPKKVDLVVAEAPPAVRGNTAQGVTKVVTLETGAEITTPIFINEGDTVRVNTETGAYAERVEKG
jgi:elongation factor P